MDKYFTKMNMNISVAVRQKFHGYQLAQQIYNRNALNTLFTSYYGSIMGKDNSIGYSIEEKNIKTNLFSAIRTYLLKDNSYKNDDSFGKWVAKHLGEEDVIVTWGIQALPILQRAHKLGIKVVLERGSAHAVSQRDILLEEYRQLGIDTAQLRSSFSSERMERELLEYELADIVGIPSSFVKRSFLKEKFPDDKLFVNAFGADLKHFEYKPIPHNSFQITYAGSLSIRKGIHYLLQAFAELNLPFCELTLTGRIEPEIIPFIKKYESPAIKISSPVPQHMLCEIYNSSDVFVICSLEEGMAMVQPQAMACGLPLICTTNTGGDDLIENGKEGFVIPIRDVNSLKEKIIFYYENRDVCKQHGLLAYKKICKGYSWNDYGDRAYEFYKQLL